MIKKEEKMRKFKSILLVVLAVLLAMPMFAGGSKETKQAAGTPEDPITIDLWFGAAITEAGMIPEDWVGYDIIRNELGIDLNLTMLPSNESDQDVRIQAAGAANELPDIFMVRRPVLSNLVKQGLVAQVDDCFAKMPNRTALIYDENAIAHATIDGHVYGFASPGAIAKNEGLLVRKDWLDNLGLEVPTTLDEFLEVARAFTFDDPDGNGRNDTYGYGAFVETDATLKGYPGSRLWPIMGAYGVEGLWSFDSETAGLSIYKPEFYDFMVTLKQMCDEGIIDPNWLSYKKDDFRAAWKQGRFGMMYEQNAAYAATANYAPFDANFPDGEWIVIDAISGPEGKASIGAYDMNYRIYAVSQKAADAGKLDKICELLEWLSSDEGYYLVGWGQEGVNYVFDENGIPVAGDLGDNAFTGSKGQVVTQLRKIVFYNGDVELASRYPTYVTEVSGKTMSALTTLREMQEKKWTSAIGSGTMPTPNADVQRYYDQSLAEFLTGARALTPENWQAFIDQFNAIGGEAWNQEGLAKMQADGLIR